ncbi:MAG: hypothetical protein AAF604_04830 [Acidobacteriota bacterium]
MSRSRNSMHRLGRSSSVPYIEGEAAQDRHVRREAAAADREAELSAWCQGAGLDLRVTGEGSHWRILRSKEVIAQWWPSSGRLVRGECYRSAWKAHDITQVMRQVGKWQGAAA